MNRRSHIYLVVLIITVASLAILAVTQSYAQEESAQPENKVVRFFKNVIKWPFGIAKEGAETVARTTKRGVDTVTTTGSSAVETVTGKPEKIKDVIVEPVKGSAETAYTAVEGSIQTPVKGTKESFE